MYSALFQLENSRRATDAQLARLRAVERARADRVRPQPHERRTLPRILRLRTRSA